MGATLITAIVFFTIVIVLLVVILLFAQSKLVQTGDVNITINGKEDEPVITSAGSTLLNTLSNQKIFLPSACGGGGTCAMCKCVVASFSTACDQSPTNVKVVPDVSK